MTREIIMKSHKKKKQKTKRKKVGFPPLMKKTDGKEASKEGEDLALIKRKIKSLLDLIRTRKKIPTIEKLSKEGVNKWRKKKRGTSYATNARNLDISSMIVLSTKIKKRKEKKKTMVITWSNSEDNSMEEENENKLINMCFMAIDEVDEVNLRICKMLLRNSIETLKNVS